MFSLLRGGGVATNGPSGARNSPQEAGSGGGSWCPRVHTRDAHARCRHMPTTSTTPPTPTVDRLWKDADIAAYLGCCDPTPVTHLPGFPARLDLPGVRGGRWYGPHVVAFFERLSTTATSTPAVAREPQDRPSLPAFVPSSKKAVA